jgi:hypothetical protein
MIGSGGVSFTTHLAPKEHDEKITVEHGLCWKKEVLLEKTREAKGEI